MFRFLRRNSPNVEASSLPSAFVYTVHKAGSMFLHELCAEVAPKLGLIPVSLNDPAFSKRIDPKNWGGFIESFAESRACFGPIRLTPGSGVRKEGMDNGEERQRK